MLRGNGAHTPYPDLESYTSILIGILMPPRRRLSTVSEDMFDKVMEIVFDTVKELQFYAKMVFSIDPDGFRSRTWIVGPVGGGRLVGHVPRMRRPSGVDTSRELEQIPLMDLLSIVWPDEWRSMNDPRDNFRNSPPKPGQDHWLLD